MIFVERRGYAAFPVYGKCKICHRENRLRLYFYLTDGYQKTWGFLCDRCRSWSVSIPKEVKPSRVLTLSEAFHEAREWAKTQKEKERYQIP
jgi:hypothetical protein